MPMPPSVTKITRGRNGGKVEFTSNIDRAKYTIDELSRAALRDVGKVMKSKMIKEARQLPGMKKSKRPMRAFQTWNRARSKDLLVGVKHGTWYGEQQELGTHNQPARHIIRNTVYNNIGLIREIESKYLSAIEDEMKAQALINEGDATGDETN